MAKKDTELTRFLRRCKKRISDPEKWTTGCEMRKRDGQEMYCLIGAVKSEIGGIKRSDGQGRYSFDTEGLNGTLKEAKKIIADAIFNFQGKTRPKYYMNDENTIIGFNDGYRGKRKTISHPAIMEVMNEAIKTSRK